MGLTKDDAFTILELPFGASQDEVRSSYKRLALKWHPDKHSNSPEATKKFQQVSSAYKRLTSSDSDDEINLTPADMFDLFAHIFFHRNGMFGCCPGRNMYDSDDSYYSDDDDDDDDDDDVNNEILNSIASNLRRKYEKRVTEKTPSGKPAHNLSEAEAMKNANDLIEEEERDRKKAEKRRAKKKRNKERKKERERGREKKEKDEKENIQQKNTKKENIPTSKPPSRDVDKKSKSSSNIPTTPSKTVNNNTKFSSGLKEQCVNNSTIPHQPARIDPISNKRREDDDVSGGEEPTWDTSSAFFARAAGRNPASTPASSTTPIKSNTPLASDKSSVNVKNGAGKKEQSDQIDPVVLRSRQVAVKGNEMANLGNYQDAVDLFTEAINLDAKDFRFFGNRSYCYDRMGQYEKALLDADVAISLAPDWPKGYFRRGRALAGLKLFSDAESSFAQVLKLDKHCEDAMFELARVRIQQLEEMGFPQNQSEVAIQAYGTVQAALEALLAGKVNLPPAEEIYVSDGDDDPRKPRAATIPVECDSSSDEPCRSLWVGNINPEEVSERHLLQLFSRCGRVDNVRILPKRFCAFVNYELAESANIALEKLQSYEVGGQEILLRYPNNSGQQSTQTVTSNSPVPTKKKPAEGQVKPAANKLSGPVNGDECYFWRTTGCYFAEKCRFKHVPDHKGADLRKVEAKYGGKLRVTPPATT